MHGVASSVALGMRKEGLDDANDRVELNSRNALSHCKSNRRETSWIFFEKSFFLSLFFSSFVFFPIFLSLNRGLAGKPWKDEGFSIPAICHTSETSTRNSPKGLSRAAHKSLRPFTTRLMVNGTGPCILEERIRIAAEDVGSIDQESGN